MIRIAHLADIHIRMKERHAEYEEVFETLLKQLAKDDPDRIVLVGDILHSKITMSPELVSMTRQFFIDLMGIAPLDVVAGNHDMNISNADRMDAITPIVESIDERYGEINYYRESGFYETDEVVYGVFSLNDGGEAKLAPETKNTKEGTPKPFIALYHGPIAGCLLDNGYVYSDATTPMSLFRNYDFVFLGDIHRHQFMNEDQTAAYPGSLIQQNFGESMSKGYLLWEIEQDDPKDFEVKFREVENDYGYYTLQSKGGYLPDLDLPSKCRIRVIWEMAAKDISRAVSTELTSKIYKKYKPLSVQLSFKPIEDDESQTVSLSGGTNLSNQSTHHDLLGQWLAKHCDDEGDIKKVLDIDKSVFEAVVDPAHDDRNGSTWDINVVTISNFMSYPEEDTVIDFTNMEGVVGLFGNNAVGKSVVLDAILYALFNKISRNVKNEDLVNTNNDNPVCRVVLDMNIRGVQYRIDRWTTRQFSKKTGDLLNARTDVRFMRKYYGDDEWENLSDTQRTETEKIIRGTIGSFEDFLLTSLTTQNHVNVSGKIDATEFLSLRPALRSDNMLRFLGLDIFMNKHDHAKDVLKGLERDRKAKGEDDELNYFDEKRDELDHLKTQMREVEEQIDITVVSIEDFEGEIDKRKRMINDTIKIEKDTATLEDEHKALSDEIIAIKRKKVEVEESARRLIDKLHSFEDKYILDEKILADHTKKAEQADTASKMIRKIEAEIASDKRVLGVYRDDLKNSNACPVAYDPQHAGCSYLSGYMKKKDSCAELIKRVKRSTSILEELREKYEELRVSRGVLDEQDRIRDAISQATAKLEEIRRVRSTLINKIEVKTLSLNLVSSHLKVARANEDTIKTNNRLKEEINEIEAKLVQRRAEKKVLSDQSITLSNRRAVVESEIANLESTLESIRTSEERIRLYKIYCKAMHRTGLPVDILRAYIPTMNYEINKILSDVIEFGVFLKIDHDSTDIDVVMRYNRDVDDTRPAILASGMEKLLINFAIRYSLLSVSNLNKSTTWFIDEGFGVLDSENLYSMSKFFENVRGMFRNVVIITHIDSLKDIANWVVSIDNRDGISYVNAPQKNI